MAIVIRTIHWFLMIKEIRKMKNVISLLLALLLANACTNKESNKTIKLANLPITYSISVLNLAQKKL